VEQRFDPILVQVLVSIRQNALLPLLGGMNGLLQLLGIYLEHRPIWHPIPATMQAADQKLLQPRRPLLGFVYPSRTTSSCLATPSFSAKRS
jgi:hypothetical protein